MIPRQQKEGKGRFFVLILTQYTLGVSALVELIMIHE